MNAATVNLFGMHNRMHDWAYHLGFTEARWNAQFVNVNPGTAQEDGLLGSVQSGAISGGNAPRRSIEPRNLSRHAPPGTARHRPMLVGLRSDLRQVRHAQHLPVAADAV